MFLHANSGMSGISAVCGVPHLTFVPTQLPGYVDSPFNVAYLRWAGRLWQDTAMTVPAVADGDPVRRIVCGSTYYDAPSDAARPLLWDEGGGKWSLSFDGVDDVVSAGDLEDLTGTLTLAAEFVAPSIPRYATLVAKAYNQSAYALSGYWPSANSRIGFAVNNQNSQAMSDATLADSAWHAVMGAYDGAACTLYVAGVAQTQTVARSSTITNTSDVVGVGGTGASGTFGQFWVGRIAGIVRVGSALGPTDRSLLNTYLNALAPAAPPFPESLTGYVDSPYNVALSRLHGQLWQDTTFTTRATVDGDPVRRIVCGGVYYDAPSDAARPLLYSEGGGKWSLSFDGVDDTLATSATYAGPAATFSQFGAIKRVSEANGRYFFGAYPADASNYDTLSYSTVVGTFFYTLNASGVLQFTGGGPALDTAWHRMGGTYNGSVITSYLDNSAVGTPTAQTGNLRQLYTLRLSVGSGFGLPGRIAGVVFVASALGSTDRAALDAYLATLHT